MWVPVPFLIRFPLLASWKPWHEINQALCVQCREGVSRAAVRVRDYERLLRARQPDGQMRPQTRCATFKS